MKTDEYYQFFEEDAMDNFARGKAIEIEWESYEYLNKEL